MFLANENFPRQAILFLRDKGYHVISIQESNQEISDNEVLEIAKKNKYVILTFYKDYGEIIFRYSLDSPPSVIFLRSKGTEPVYAGNILHVLMQSSGIDILNAFTVIDVNSIRQRFYAK
ncbi:MAG: DUF5615 family PIN-like protein [Saprospiraceae bacterium]